MLDFLLVSTFKTINWSVRVFLLVVGCLKDSGSTSESPPKTGGGSTIAEYDRIVCVCFGEGVHCGERKSVSRLQWIIIQKWTIYTLKTKNNHFKSRIGIKGRNYRKIIKMNQHGDNFIDFWFKKSNMKNYWVELIFEQRQLDVWPWWITKGYSLLIF